METNGQHAPSGHSPRPLPIPERSQMRLNLTVIAVLCFAVAGLAMDSVAQETTTPNNEAMRQHPDWVQVPGALVRPDCVHEIPNGATVELVNDGSGRISLNGVLIAHYDACSEAPIVTRSIDKGSKEITENQDSDSSLNLDGWLLEALADFDLSEGDNIDYLSGEWTVPPAPSQSGGLIYLFNGIQPWQDYNVILQPVLQYGKNPFFGGNYWSIASWLLTSTNYYYSNWHKVESGDTIFGLINMDAPEGDDNEWTMKVQDETRNIPPGTLYVWSAMSAYQFTRADAAVLEVHYVTSCAQLPPGSVTFTNNIATHGYPSYEALPASSFGGGITDYVANLGDPCGLNAWTDGITSTLTF